MVCFVENEYLERIRQEGEAIFAYGVAKGIPHGDIAALLAIHGLYHTQRLTGRTPQEHFHLLRSDPDIRLAFEDAVPEDSDTQEVTRCLVDNLEYESRMQQFYRDEILSRFHFEPITLNDPRPGLDDRGDP